MQVKQAICNLPYIHNLLTTRLAFKPEASSCNIPSLHLTSPHQLSDGVCICACDDTVWCRSSFAAISSHYQPSFS